MNARIPMRRPAGAAFLAITVTVVAPTVTSTARAAVTAAKPGLGALHDVAAVSAHDAWAVGYSGRGNRAQVLIEHWNGATWKRVSRPAGVMTGDLYSVSAPSSRDVWTVGTGRANRPLVLHWNGRAWRQVVIKDLPADATLNAVSAACSGNWTKVTVARKITGVLYRVTATSPRNAWAVGATSLVDPSSPVAVRWDGSAWRAVRIPL